nr:oligosaccharide flippase family protein [Pseudenhygromyxa sp. WMMC2535]
MVWGKITASLAEVLAPLLIVRLLGKGEVGAVAGLLLIYATLATVLTAGFPRATLYFLAERERAERRAVVIKLVRIMAVLSVGMGIMLALVGWLGDDVLRVFGELLSGEAAREDDELVDSLKYLPILGLYALVDLPTRLLPNILVAEERARASAGFGVVRSLVTTVAMIIPASLNMGVLGIVTATAVVGLLPFWLFIRHLWRLYADAGEPAQPVASSRELIRYSIPLGVTDIVSMLNASVDMWLIVALFPAEIVALYRAGAFQIPIVTTVAYSLGAVYLPRFTRMHREGEYREAVEIWRNSIIKVSLIVVPTSMVFFVGADQFVTLAFTEDYAGSAPVFRFYCLLMMARISAFGSFMLAAGKPDFVMRSALLTLGANIVISVPLALGVGFIGPAMGTAVAFVPTLLFYCWYIARAWKVRLRDTLPLLGYLKVVAAAALPGAAAWWLTEQLALGSVLALVVITLVVMLGFALVGTLFGLIDGEDWRFAWSWVRLKVLQD